MGEIYVLPYHKDLRTGNWTFPEASIAALYKRMQADGVADLVFYDGSVRDPETFVRLMQQSVTFVVNIGGETGGLAWINRLQSRWGQLNFTCFSNVWGKESVRIGTHTLKTLIHMTEPGNGMYLWDAFLGITPVCNTYACEYVLKCGGKKIGILPNGCWFAEEKTSKDAMLVSYTREDAE